MNEITVNIKEKQDSHRILSIEIASSKVKREREKIISGFQRKAKIPGFRPGKTPRQLIESKYRDDIKMELMESMLTEAYKEAIEEQQLVPISHPEFSKVESSLDSSMSFEAAFDVKPEVEVKRYTGFRVERTVKELTDTEVEGVLEKLRRERALTRPVERPAERGDLVSIEYLSLDEDGQLISDEPKKNIDLNLGDGGVLDDIEEGIVGMNTGDEKEIGIDYPEDYFVESLRGSRRKLKLTLLEVKDVELPVLDDEFARGIDPSKNLGSLREEIMTRLIEEREQQSKKEAVEKLFDLVIEANPFEAPRIIVENILTEFLERLRQERQNAGQDFDPEKVRDTYRPIAVRLFKKNFMIETIAKLEGLGATEEDMAEELESISQGSDAYLDSLKRGLEKDPGAKENFKSEITSKKVAEFLLNNSEVREQNE
jgi:trigger factor